MLHSVSITYLYNWFSHLCILNHLSTTDSKARCVTVLSNTGEVVSRFGRCGREPGKFAFPSNVAVSADKHIFVDDSFHRRIQKFTFSSSYEAVYDAANVYGVAIHPTSQKVLCTNHTKCNVTVLNADLTLSHSFGDKKFINPYGIAIDTKCMLLIATKVWYSSSHQMESI